MNATGQPCSKLSLNAEVAAVLCHHLSSATFLSFFLFWSRLLIKIQFPTCSSSYSGYMFFPMTSSCHEFAIACGCAAICLSSIFISILLTWVAPHMFAHAQCYHSAPGLKVLQDRLMLRACVILMWQLCPFPGCPRLPHSRQDLSEERHEPSEESIRSWLYPWCFPFSFDSCFRGTDAFTCSRGCLSQEKRKKGHSQLLFCLQTV